MKILIDTQIFIWLINDDKRLGPKAKKFLYASSSQLYMSYFSVFEMTIKASIGKLEYNDRVLENLPDMGIELLFPDKTTLNGYKIFNSENKDPYDNVLITTAINGDLLFVTSDPKILRLSEDNLKLFNATQ